MIFVDILFLVLEVFSNGIIFPLCCVQPTVRFICYLVSCICVYILYFCFEQVCLSFCMLCIQTVTYGGFMVDEGGE